MKPNTIYDPRWKLFGLADKEYFLPSELTSLYTNYPDFDDIWNMYKEFLKVKKELQEPYAEEKSVLEQEKSRKEEELSSLQQKLQNIETVLNSLDTGDPLSLAVKTLLEDSKKETEQKILILQQEISDLSSQIQELSTKIKAVTQRYNELYVNLGNRIAEIGGTWEG